MNALVTMSLVNDARRSLCKRLTFPRMRAYAKKYGMDFLIISECRRDKKLGAIWDYERMDALYAILKDYDRVLHLEDDVIVREGAPDVTALPEGIFYGFDNAPSNPEEVQRCWDQAKATWTDELAGIKRPMLHLFNTGFFLCDKSHRPLFAPTAIEPYNENLVTPDLPSHYKGQGLLAARMNKYQTIARHLPSVFGVSWQWSEGQPFPSFMHVLWYMKGSKEDGIQEFIERMDAK